MQLRLGDYFMLIYALVFSKDALKISEYYLQAKIRFRNVKAGANQVKRVKFMNMHVWNEYAFKSQSLRRSIAFFISLRAEQIQWNYID